MGGLLQHVRAAPIDRQLSHELPARKQDARGIARGAAAVAYCTTR